MSEPTFTFDKFKKFEPDDTLLGHLAKLFAIEPDVTAIVFVWQSAGYNDHTTYGGNGWIEYETKAQLNRAALAEKNKDFVAAAWVFEGAVNNEAEEFLAATDGNATSLICLPSGHFFVVEQIDYLHDPENYLDADRLLADGVIAGISMAGPHEPSGHEIVEAMERFEDAYPWFCCHVREIIENNTDEKE